MTDADIRLLLVDAVIVVASTEALLLAAWRLGTGLGPPVADVVATLGAGLCLLGALRSVLAGAAWPACAIWLAAAGVAHAADVLRRWRVAATRPGAGVEPPSLLS